MERMERMERMQRMSSKISINISLAADISYTIRFESFAKVSFLRKTQRMERMERMERMQRMSHRMTNRIQ
jgi:hypothetical protein